MEPGKRKEAVFPDITIPTKRFKSPKVGVSNPKVSKQILYNASLSRQITLSEVSNFRRARMEL